MAVDMKVIDAKIRQIEDKKNIIKELLKKYGKNVDEIDSVNSNLTSQFILKCSSLKDIKVACVMDRFTLDSFSPECNLFEVTPMDWKSEIDEFKPDMLFIESAWQGKDGLWYRKIANGSTEFFEMSSYCQEQNIPIVFWNKEDPVYTDVFMVVARMADVVFTTDIDCIKKYKDTLKHDNVYHLHFAAQPVTHNPIEKYERKDKYCFAGAYYHRYKERSEVFDRFSEVFINDKGLDIYDRNYKSALPEHAFPSSYDKYILGKLDPSEIDVAYKGYNYGINMNSISQSQTMFARRVFEMLASNTVTIGNYSRGTKNYFGDLTICTNDEDTLKKDLDKYCGNDTNLRKYRLQGLRKVLSQHLYEDRLNYIVEKVFKVSLKRNLTRIIALGYANNLNEAKLIIDNFNRQCYKNKELYIITNNDNKIIDIKNLINTSNNIKVLNESEAEELKIQNFNEHSFISTISPNDYYGINYYTDLILTTRYGVFDGIGKYNYYINNNNSSENNDNNSIIIEDKNNTYKYVKELSSERSIIKVSNLKGKSINYLSKPILIKLDKLFSIDEFNYCKNYLGSVCPIVDDMKIVDQGISIKKIEETAENIKNETLNVNGYSINCDEILEFSNLTKISKVRYTKNNMKLLIESNLGDSHQYIYVQKIFEVSDYIINDKLGIIFNGIGDLDLTGVCVFYDRDKKKISPIFTGMNRLLLSEVPDQAKYFKLGLRPKGNGKFILDNIVIGIEKNFNNKVCSLARSNVLILTNHYPKKGDLYRNMFVHKRITLYKDEGLVCDVMRMNIYAKNEFREFDGINITEGQSEELSNILENGNIDTVCVHFLDSHMWGVLKNYVDKLHIIIWSHGADIQPWWRRKFNYTSENEIEKAKKQSEERMKFWSEVFDESNQKNMRFVFVSNYAANIVMEDYKLKLGTNKYSIIPNLIDTNMFKYLEKDIEQRKNIISIRPYTSKIYANDITVKVIQELSKKDFFEELEFTIIGDGELFDEITKPLKKFKNVRIEKGFIRQEKIAELYRKNGVVLIPSRADTQGVSRDEAMSSGLVPVTNAVAAIPEFVDDICGVLVDGEDYISMVQGIEKLYREPHYFTELSKNAAARVRSQSSKRYTIDKEIELILDK